jgi:ribonuclease-3
MTDPIVVFTTTSDVEAKVVRGLLETHGIPVLMSAEALRAIFPAPATAQGDVRLSVPAELADEARQIIESHRNEGSPGAPVVPLAREFVPLERRIRYRFRDRGLLEHALTHTSRFHEDVTGGVLHNESLEFLGDAVLGLVIAEALYREHPELDEGEKSKIKASLVSAARLSKLAEELDLGSYLLLGRGEEKSGGRRKTALLADACEALIAAIYLDGGLESAAGFIRREIWSGLGSLSHPGGLAAVVGDYKSALQEVLQETGRGLPEYRVVGERGPAHERLFDVELYVEGRLVARTSGRTKKEAEQEAARVALDASVPPAQEPPAHADDF